MIGGETVNPLVVAGTKTVVLVITLYIQLLEASLMSNGPGGVVGLYYKWADSGARQFSLKLEPHASPIIVRLAPAPGRGSSKLSRLGTNQKAIAYRSTFNTKHRSSTTTEAAIVSTLEGWNEAWQMVQKVFKELDQYHTAESFEFTSNILV